MSKIPGLRYDPFPAFRFYINLVDSSGQRGAAAVSSINAILGAALGGFSECTGMDMSMEIYEYKEGGVNDIVHKFPTRASYSNITLRRGLCFNDELWNWHYGFVQYKGRRMDGIITLMNEIGIPVKVWHFKNGIPVNWRGPDLNATENSLAVESLEIAHEGIELYTPQAQIPGLLY
ncbi:MAG: phage tail protein [Spirochaetales bacterium]|nr:phage tail protein [Spirochaetales bacterium]